MIMQSGANSKPRLTANQLRPFKLRSFNVQKTVHQDIPGIISCAFKSTTSCPEKTCIGQLVPIATGGNFGQCNITGCPKRVKLPLVAGEIEIHGITLLWDWGLPFVCL